MQFSARVCIWVLLYIFIAVNMRFEIQLRLASSYKKQLINCLPIVCNKGCTAQSHCAFSPHFFYTGCYVEMGRLSAHMQRSSLFKSLFSVPPDPVYPALESSWTWQKEKLYASLLFRNMDLFREILFSLRTKMKPVSFTAMGFSWTKRISQAKSYGLIPCQFMKGMLIRKFHFITWSHIGQR